MKITKKCLFLCLLLCFARKGESNSNSLGMKFVNFEADTFIMGSPEREEGRFVDERQVKVILLRPFAMMTTEVTQRQWHEVMGYNPSYFSSPEYCVNNYREGMCPEHPVEKVSWDDVQKFVRRLNEMEGNMDCHGTPNSGVGCYRLPTEAEWEYAARAGTETAYFFGNNPEDMKGHGWYRENAKGRTQKVGKKKANRKGLHDMHGNVYEWVQDGYVRELPGGVEPLKRYPTLEHIVRGGSWKDTARYLRSAYRGVIYPEERYNDLGFRLVRNL